jgi:ATP-binding cassette, subfamily B, bacterial
MGFFSGQFGKIFWTTFAAAGQTLIIIPSLLLVKYAFDIVIPDRNTGLLITIGVGIFLLRIVNGWIAVVLRRYHIRIINGAVYALRDDLIRKLYRFTHLFYTNADLRILHVRIVQDTERLGHLGTAIISRLFPSVIISLGLLIVCFILNWYLLLTILALFPLLIVANRMMGRKIRTRVVIFQRAFEEFSKGVQFLLKYMPLTTIQSAQPQEIARHRAILTDLQQKTGRMADIFALNLQVQEILTGLSAIIIIIVGGIAVATQSMSIGDFLSFYLAALFLNKHINTITGAVPDIISGNVSLNTLHTLASDEQEYQHMGDRVIDFDGEIRMDQVSFSYGEKEILHEINLHIMPGERVAIIGPNGTGKTTILNLITGLIIPDTGHIEASGHPYKTIRIDALRQRIGVVTQQPLLFPGTIADNIAYGDEIADMDRVVAAAMLACADGFIDALPEVYHTQVGDEGVLLSGGERQRIAIARALYRRPAMLILDEPTNHLDSNAVGVIMENLKLLDTNPSVLMISHEKSVFQFADRILQLGGGQLTQYEPSGNQQELHG